MERALYNKNGQEVVLMIWEGYGFWFAAEDGAIGDDVICECFSRRQVGMALIASGYRFVRSL